MRLVIVGVDDGGRSSVAASQVLDGARPEAMGGFAVEPLFSTSESPPPLQLDPGTPVEDVGCPPEGTAWLRISCEEGATYPLHRTRTVDYDVVLSGSLDLLLEDGHITLRPGDAVLMQGQLHGWRGGPGGATYAVVLLGAGR